MFGIIDDLLWFLNPPPNATPENMLEEFARRHNMSIEDVLKIQQSSNGRRYTDERNC